jgi:predicted DNA-binding transcriptional regulator AlpA
MAGVTRPAASNWRRRNTDFPQPVEETGATSLFRYADVSAWMARHHKRWDSRSVEQLVWSSVNPERAVIRPEEAARAGIALLGYTALASRVDGTLAKAIRAAIAAEDRAGLRTLFDRSR